MEHVHRLVIGRPMLRHLVAWLQLLLAAARDRTRPHANAGQASVEYALVLLGAALVATLLISWATSTNLISDLFDYVLGLVKGKARG